MFCSKCGQQIGAEDRYCPKCGERNQNYIEPQMEKQQSIKKCRFSVPKIKYISKKSVVRGITVCAVIVFVGIGVFKFAEITADILGFNKVKFSPQGMVGYLDKNKNANFIIGTDVISLKGFTAQAVTSPDHKKRLSLLEDEKIYLYDEKNTKGVEIASDVQNISAVSDFGVYYTVGKKEHLFLYDFVKKETVDIGFEECNVTYSAGKTTVVGVDSNGTLSIFYRKTGKQKQLCNIGDDADIICVADNGKNLFWSIKNENTFSVYTLKNGAPERIGKIIGSEESGSISGRYYNNDKSCILYSPRSTQLILVQKNMSKEVTLPGSWRGLAITNSNGDYIDSDDDKTKDVYISVKKSSGSNQCALYKLSQKGNLSEVIGNIADSEYNFDNLYNSGSLSEATDYIADIMNKINNVKDRDGHSDLRDDYYALRGGYVYYVNTEGDLYRKNIKDKGEGDRITTDVSKIFVSPSGKYVYIVKMGGLYYWSTNDKSYELKVVSTAFDDRNQVYLSNKDDVIFYTGLQKEIKDTNSKHGTLYRYKVNEPVQTVTSEVLKVLTNDEQYCDADHPTIRKYISNEDDDYIVSYGTLSEGKYITLLSDVEY